MEIPRLDRAVQASDLPLERLANSDQLSKEQKIGEAARQFEAVLLRQILSQAQKPLFQNSLFPSGGTANAIYQDMVTQQLADRISEGGTFGFASVLKRELTTQYGEKTTPSDKTNAGNATQSVEKKIGKYKSPAIQPGKRI
jgi:Rod binding domain-containing protein